MSFLGNIAAAQSAKAISKYNNSVIQQQVSYSNAKRKINAQSYNEFTRPILVKRFKKDNASDFVTFINSGAEIRPDESPYLTLLENSYNRATDLAIRDFNQEMDQTELTNQSLLLEARGRGQLFQGQLTARTEYYKAAGSLLSTANDFDLV
tara:strand:- start:565 stop:1017 length:453 start_codon:yes stop_codon:yes gene_type:complete